MVILLENSKIFKDFKCVYFFDFFWLGRIVIFIEVILYDGVQCIFVVEDKFKSIWNVGVVGICVKVSFEFFGDVVVYDRYCIIVFWLLFIFELGIQIKVFYESLIDKLFIIKSYILVFGSKFVDFVCDIVNIVLIYFVVSVFGFLLIIKENRKGIYIEYEFYVVFQIIVFVFFVDLEFVKFFFVVEVVKMVVGQFGIFVDKMVKSFKVVKNSVFNIFGVNFIKEFKKVGLVMYDIIWNYVFFIVVVFVLS